MALTKISRGLLDTGVSDSSDATAITIDSSENVGIGTSSPARSPLHLATSGSNYCQLHMTNGTSGSTSGDGLTLFTNSTDAGLMQRENSYLLFGTNDTERMRITSTGYVGIGTSSPSKLFSISGGDFSFNAGTGDLGNKYMVINAGTSNDGGFILQRDNTNQWQIVNGTNDGDLLFYSYGTSSSVLYIDRSTGAVGMGFTGQISGATLSVYSNADGGIVIGSSSGSNAYRKIYHNPSNGILYFTSSSNSPYLSNAGGWTNASDVSIKKDIVDIDYGLSTVESLQPRRYKMKSDDENQIGFIAQEMESVIPELVSGEEDKKGINYGQLTAVLTKAIQELKAKNDALEARIETLENA